MLRLSRWIFILFLIFAATPLSAQPAGGWSVAEFLNRQPGPLKDLIIAGRSAADIIEEQSSYFGVSPFLSLALLEATAGLLSNPSPPSEAISHPFGLHGPAGFDEQIAWVNRELRAGLGPYQQPPVIRLSDGLSLTLSLAEPAEWIAMKRFLAQGRDSATWLAAVKATHTALKTYFDGELAPPAAAPAGNVGWLRAPWPPGTRVIHLAYFDHMYPMVDLGGDGNGEMVDYLGRRNVQYNSHDGHDYVFPEAPFATPILAAAAGTAYAFNEARGLGVVIVHPNGYETVYWHLSALDPIFSNGNGIPVVTGQRIGVSGASGVSGTPHLHFEVRRWEGGIRKQVDPYGWHGPGPDPCPNYAGCAASEWLWHPDLIGTYDFTPPDYPAQPVDTTPPIGTLWVSPPDDLLLAVTFDGHPAQTVGQGLPQVSGTLRFAPGRFGQALISDDAEIAFPTTGNFNPDQGTISLWVEVPTSWSANSLNRHYLWATSAEPTGAPVYTGTLALRRDRLGPNNSAQWTFWTVGDVTSGEDLLSVPDTLPAGWHHFAVIWDATSGTKVLYIDGERVAERNNAVLPVMTGGLIHLGRFSSGGAAAGVKLDELAAFDRPLTEEEIAVLASAPPLTLEQRQLNGQGIRIDTNAIDDNGSIAAVILGINGELSDPLPYYDSYRWSLPPIEGSHVVEVHYLDRAGNTTIVTQTVQLNLPPQVEVHTAQIEDDLISIQITAFDQHQPLEMQFSATPDFADATWIPFLPEVRWRWGETETRRLFVRLRDATGLVTEPIAINAPTHAVFVPFLAR
ncbi:LamG-like jellyroll fold domain-containing protein [Chloroflexus sp.]|uniref:LamG-like jellyroll fold domain-containing protein n=1 Tax=Chloroflexus sp. TaxID=1904827 RepID=UPI00261A2A05|nr:LamG-like jellyroll fold domain-containing protein [uncultured Chloroflexus sp.]